MGLSAINLEINSSRALEKAKLDNLDAQMVNSQRNNEQTLVNQEMPPEIL